MNSKQIDGSTHFTFIGFKVTLAVVASSSCLKLESYCQSHNPYHMPIEPPGTFASSRSMRNWESIHTPFLLTIKEHLKD